MRACALAVVATAFWLTPVAAHPMPNSVVALSLRDDGAVLHIAVPLPELRLVMPTLPLLSGGALPAPERLKVEDYFRNHCAVLTHAGGRIPLRFQSASVWQAKDENVGSYEELRLQLFAPADAGYNPRSFDLAYDAVIHQVPNHFALVQVAQDFRDGRLSDDRAPGIGAIRYDFRYNVAPVFHVQAASGNLWRGLRSVIALGFRHVTTGTDHVLFLLTLLVVAPLQVNRGAWSLFQGWRYTLRRFLGISGAFTIGHSVALVAGVFAGLPVHAYAIEILIAASILLAAIHAIWPLFTGREWLVAAGFGTVHGLAFSESLANLSATPAVKAFAVAGFNVGVECAQLVVMACALPVLIASRWRVFHTIRVGSMICTALTAGVWILQRAA